VIARSPDSEIFFALAIAAATLLRFADAIFAILE
jgi:hypothetical protein